MTLSYYAPTASDPTVGEIVPSDLACRQCGANLKDLHTSSLCPGCGTPVGVSRYGDMLAYAQPNWLKNLRTGALILLWTNIGLAVLLVALFAVLMGLVMSARSGGRPPGTPDIETILQVVHFTTLAGFVLNIVGAWLLTRPDPTGAGEPAYGTMRHVCLVLLSIGLLLSGILSTLPYLVNPDAIHPQVAFGLLQLSNGMTTAGFVMLCVYLSRLAMRMPDAKLSRGFKIVAWGTGLPMIIFALLQVALVYALTPEFPRASGGSFQTVGCVLALLGLELVGMGIMFLVLLGMTASRLGKARRTALTLVG